ncbi:MAG TPA: translation initiation factor IF-3 [Fimbriimonadaceae bacterium]|nr:translation initiation factor IF-3 [Fimbriimonadaceae bacterium]HRJ34076.1 translation initiation factor IF-3 [Fimbriimonadaceae bacterium]
MNERVLRFRDIRVIGSDGTQIGILQSRQALDMAREEGLDLVMVSPQAVPPVCRIIDHGRFKYDQEKLNKENKKKKQQEMKTVKMRPGTAPHDLNILVRNATKFLAEGNKVKVSCQFRAREITHPEIGLKKMQAVAEQLAEVGIVERAPALDGKFMIMILIPKPVKEGKKNAKAQDAQDSGEAIQDNGLGEDHAT